MKTFLTKWSFF